MLDEFYDAAVPGSDPICEHPEPHANKCRDYFSPHVTANSLTNREAAGSSRGMNIGKLPELLRKW
jgi:hypothetical protein